MSTFILLKNATNYTHLLKAFERSIVDFDPILSPGSDIKVGIIDYVVKIIGGRREKPLIVCACVCSCADVLLSLLLLLKLSGRPRIAYAGLITITSPIIKIATKQVIGIILWSVISHHRL
jgi:hypothetical protein